MDLVFCLECLDAPVGSTAGVSRHPRLEIEPRRGVAWREEHNIISYLARALSVTFKLNISFASIACEQQTHFRSSLLSLGREATTGNASAVRRLLLHHP